MDSHILQNFLSPPVLFFFLGLIAALARSDLEIPQPLPKFFSLYLLMAIGFKGGVELNHSGLSASVAFALGAAMVMAVVVPTASLIPKVVATIRPVITRFADIRFALDTNPRLEGS